MNFLHISDTHEQHEAMYWLQDPEYTKHIDCIIHTGDGSNPMDKYSNELSMRKFLDWFKDLDIPYRIFIPGNHDTSIEAGFIDIYKEYPTIDCLINGTMDIELASGKNVKIWGSPITPSFGDGWAYNCSRSKIQNYWDQIPEDVDIIATHGPPMGINDITGNGPTGLYQQVGCKSLMNTVEKIKPKYHLFGHIHDESNVKNYSHKLVDGVNYINSAVCNLRYDLVHKGHKFTI